MPAEDSEAPSAVTLLSRLIACRTVVGEPGAAEAFVELESHLLAAAPQLAAACERERVGEHGLLWRWPGGDASRSVVLMAHQDVVPAAREDGWASDPFSAEVAGGRVSGRGALDDKADLVAKLLSAQALAKDGWAPPVDVWFFFGDNEETAGDTAVLAVRRLAERGVRPELVMDEGGLVAEGAFPGVDVPQAVLGLGEKGLLSVRLSTRSAGGHASFPPRVSAIDRLVRALRRLHRRPFPASLHPVTRSLLAHLATRARGPLSAALRAAAGSGRAGAKALTALGGETAALARTTLAATRLNAGEANNVLAPSASAVLNLRLAPGTTVDAAVARLRRVVRDDAVQIEVLEGNDPSPVSDPSDPHLILVREALAVSHPEADLAAYITIAATDARHFHAISDNVYRFTPLRADAAARASMHGVNESVEVSELARAVTFYRELLLRL